MPEQTTAGEFVGRWKERDLTERAGAQAHFIDLCRLLAVPAPTDNRITDSDYGFEARTDVSASGVYATRTENGPCPSSSSFIAVSRSSRSSVTISMRSRIR